MKAENAITRKYMENNAVFADVFNFYIFDGEQVIKPEELREADTAFVSVLGRKGRRSYSEKYRDILKTAVFKTDGKAAYLLLGIENQTIVHYAMPIRCMMYDAAAYDKQRQLKSKENKVKAHNSKEFLSGFGKDDRLVPVITLVVYFGADKWDAPLDLHSMLTTQDERILKYVSNYKINLIEPSKLTIDDYRKLRTELKQAFRLIQLSKDKNGLKKEIKKAEVLDTISRDTAELIEVVSKVKIEIPKNEEETGMCEALNELIQEGEARGEARGIAIGEARGEKRLLIKMVKDGDVSIEVAAKQAEMTVEEFKTLLENSEN